MFVLTNQQIIVEKQLEKNDNRLRRQISNKIIFISSFIGITSNS